MVFYDGLFDYSKTTYVLKEIMSNVKKKMERKQSVDV
jgi:hypothetical protein